MAGQYAAITPIKTADHYDLDDGDDTHPIYVPYVVPSNSNGIYKVTFSWLRKAFRSTADLNPSSIGSTTPSVDATGSSGHDHIHDHTWHINDGTGITAELSASSSAVYNGTGVTGDIATTTVATAESGHSHDHTHGSHSHALSGSGTQSVTDGATATVTALSLDGVDYTATLGGPWADPGRAILSKWTSPRFFRRVLECGMKSS